MVLKGSYIEMFVQFLNIFGKNNLWKMAEFFYIGICDIPTTSSDILGGQTLLKLLLGHTHKYKIIHELISKIGT
jgi:hypothetical protein